MVSRQARACRCHWGPSMSRLRLRRAAPRRPAADLVGQLIWLVVAVGLVVNLAAGRGSDGTVQLAHVITLGTFFVLILLRIALAAIRWPQRRGALLVLFAALSLWAAGSAALNASAQPDLTHFPAPGEWLFLASYVGLAGYLI